jgi:hypothetical protein
MEPTFIHSVLTVTNAWCGGACCSPKLVVTRNRGTVSFASRLIADAVAPAVPGV